MDFFFCLEICICLGIFESINRFWILVFYYILCLKLIFCEVFFFLVKILKIYLNLSVMLDKKKMKIILNYVILEFVF